MQLTRTPLNKQRCVPQGDRHVSVNIRLIHSYEPIKFSKVVFGLQEMHFSLTAFWFPGRGKKFLSPSKRTNQLWCRRSLLLGDTKRSLSPGVKRLGRETDNVPSLIVEVENKWIYSLSSPTCVCCVQRASSSAYFIMEIHSTKGIRVLYRILPTNNLS